MRDPVEAAGEAGRETIPAQAGPGKEVSGFPKPEVTGPNPVGGATITAAKFSSLREIRPLLVEMARHLEDLETGAARGRIEAAPHPLDRGVGDHQRAEKRFWAKVGFCVCRPFCCWPWHGALTLEGYGIFAVAAGGAERRIFCAHRLAYQLIRGPIPAGMQLDHLCRVRHCVNPTHVEVVTSAENNRRSAASVRRERQVAAKWRAWRAIPEVCV